jgi:hypothetical protein
VLTLQQEKGRASRRTKRHQARKSQRIRSRGSSRPNRWSRKPRRQEQLPQLRIKLDDTALSRNHFNEAIYPFKNYCSSLHSILTTPSLLLQYSKNSQPPYREHHAHFKTNLLDTHTHSTHASPKHAPSQSPCPPCQSHNPYHPPHTISRYAHDPVSLSGFAILRLQRRTTRRRSTVKSSLSSSASRDSMLASDNVNLGFTAVIDGEGGKNPRSFSRASSRELSLPLLSLTRRQSGVRGLCAGFCTLESLRWG